VWWVAVHLVGFYWDVELRSDAIAITGALSLSGHVSSVDGIREKLLGTFRSLVRKLPGPSGVMKDGEACLLLPADNMRYGKVGTYRDLVDGAGFDKVGRLGQGRGRRSRGQVAGPSISCPRMKGLPIHCLCVPLYLRSRSPQE
jgi:hypothetical protein